MKKSVYLLSLGTVLLASAAAPDARAEKGDILFSEDFQTEESLDQWTNIDNNGGLHWMLLNDAACYGVGTERDLPGNDWLISPAITLEKGRVYDLSLHAMSMTRTESIRICYGTAPTAEGMTNTLWDEPEFVKSKTGDYTFRIIPETDGTYYIGFYAYSAPDQHRMEFDNLVLRDSGSTLAPSAVSDLTVTRGPEGAMTATITFGVPATDLAGNPLGENVTRIDLYRGQEGEPLASLTDLMPGSAQSWTDGAVAETGWNTYRLVTFNAAGEGDAAEARDFIGHDMPKPVTDLLVTINADKSATVNWTAPTESVEGGYVDFTGLTYRVVRNDGLVVDEAMKQTTFNDVRPIAEGQGVVYYEVTAVSPAGRQAETVTSNSVTTGAPLSLPYAESFAGMKYTGTPWTQDGEVKDFDWFLTFDDEYGEVEEVISADRDGGMLSADNSWADYGAQSRIVSPMIDLSSASAPTLKFSYYQAMSPWYDPEWDGEINDRFKVQISHNGGEWEDITDAEFYLNVSPTGWVDATVQLPRNEDDEFVNIAFLATSENDSGAYRNIYIDRISIDESEVGKDLAILQAGVDIKRSNVGELTTFKAVVTNRGREAATGYTVRWERDGQTVATLPGAEIAVGERQEYTYQYTPVLDDAYLESIPFRAVIDFEGDELPANNTSEVISHSVRHLDLLPVESLTGTYENGTVTLCWPALQSYEEPYQASQRFVYDDFESYEPFLTEGFGDWTVYDGDKSITLDTPRIPVDYPHRGEPMAWQVFNVEELGVFTDEYEDTAFAPYYGKQYLACPAAEYPAENDDWLITPRLDGRVQTITFRAKPSTFDSEWIKVYYSTTDNHPDSFIPLNNDEVIYVNSWWTTDYKFTVPSGARYFAVRCVRRTVFLFVDDFIYAEWDGIPSKQELLGYNVYRDGVMVNGETPLSEPTFTEAAPEGARYTVTGVYAEGESAYSPEYVAELSGIDYVGTESADIAVTATRGAIRISGVTDYTIYTLEGLSIARGTSDGEVTVPVPAGIYAVRTAAGATKIMVK